jgi:copper chaperone CopZ
MKIQLFLILTFACVVTAALAEETGTTAANATNRFVVSGMHCDGCAQGITSELKRAPGVAFASVSFSNKLAVIGYDTNRISAKGLKKVIVEAGFEAKPAKP